MIFKETNVYDGAKSKGLLFGDAKRMEIKDSLIIN